MKNNIPYILTALILVALLALLTDPFMLWMPPMATMAVLLGVVVLLCVWAGFVMYEQADDERDAFHRMHAGRAAYLSGVTVLTIGLLIQGFAHAIDPWVAGALGVMVVAKFSARLYTDRYR